MWWRPLSNYGSLWFISAQQMSRSMTKPAKWFVRPAKTQIFAQSDQSIRCPHKEALGLVLPIKRTAKTLIRLGGCPGWSASSLGAHVILLVLSCGGLDVKRSHYRVLHTYYKERDLTKIHACTEKSEQSSLIHKVESRTNTFQMNCNRAIVTENIYWQINPWNDILLRLRLWQKKGFENCFSCELFCSFPIP